MTSCRQAHEQIKHAAQMCEKTERKRVAAEKMAITLRKQLQEQAASPRTSRSDLDQADADSHIAYLQTQLQAQEQLVLEAQHIKEWHRLASCGRRQHSMLKTLSRRLNLKVCDRAAGTC